MSQHDPETLGLPPICYIRHPTSGETVAILRLRTATDLRKRFARPNALTRSFRRRRPRPKSMP